MADIPGILSLPVVSGAIGALSLLVGLTQKKGSSQLWYIGVGIAGIGLSLWQYSKEKKEGTYQGVGEYISDIQFPWEPNK